MVTDQKSTCVHCSRTLWLAITPGGRQYTIDTNNNSLCFGGDVDCHETADMRDKRLALEMESCLQEREPELHEILVALAPRGVNLDTVTGAEWQLTLGTGTERNPKRKFTGSLEFVIRWAWRSLDSRGGS